MPLVPLPLLLVQPIVRQALLEDLGRAGDVTTDAIAPADKTIRRVMDARQEGVVAGLSLAALAFRLIDPAIRFQPALADGARVTPGGTVALPPARRAACHRQRTALNC